MRRPTTIAAVSTFNKFEGLCQETQNYEIRHERNPTEIDNNSYAYIGGLLLNIKIETIPLNFTHNIAIPI